MLDLSAWNALLLADLRAHADPSRLLYLYVDREHLGRLSQLSAEDAVASFCAAVQSASGPQPFERARIEAQRFRSAGFAGEPTFVAHLAITVLAVTEEPLGSSSNVYRRQNQLLGLQGEGAPPGYVDDVPMLWSIWNEWLAGPGSYLGRPSARTHDRFWTRQGWARSQGLVRHTDRRRIDGFLDDMAGTVAPSEDLSKLFMEWLGFRGQPGADMLQRFADEASLQVLTDVLHDEQERWTKEGPRAATRRQARGLLVYDDWTQDFRAVLVNDDSWHGMPLDVGTGLTTTPDAFDSYVFVNLEASPASLLRDGASHTVAAGRTLAWGGEDLYLFRDEPAVSGRLQTRTAALGISHHALVPEARVDSIVAALQEAGAQALQRPSSLSGWVWLENILLERDAPLLRMLGLAAALPMAVDRPLLAGGLKIGRGNDYLVGFEPDVVLPAGVSELHLDEVLLGVTGDERRVHLAEHCPEPGDHTVSTVQGAVHFRTVAYLRESAASGGLWRTIETSRAGSTVGEAQRDAQAPTALSGALLRGIGPPHPPVLNVRAGAELLVLLEDGSLFEVAPTYPRWVSELAIQTFAVDLRHAIRTMTPRPAVALSRQLPSRRKEAVAIPENLALLPGAVPKRARLDLSAELVSDPWHWQGLPDEKLRSRLGGELIRRGAGSADPPLPRPVAVTTRGDVVRDTIPNPYDDVLQWMSEQEAGRTSAAAFADAWHWLCRRHSMDEIATDWRLALTRISALGHVERDHRRQQVAVAPATLLALPSAAGLTLLAGARPLRLLERLEDPDDPEMGDAACCWTLHIRTPLTDTGRPAGPAVVYVEWDRRQEPQVAEGLEQLGVSLTGMTAEALLALLPTLPELLRDSEPYTMSPGRDLLHWEREQTGAWRWNSRRTDIQPGFYCYRLPHGRQFAWRTEPDGRLLPIEPALGRWLSRQRAGHGELLYHQVVENELLVPAELPLPTLLARALTLRTGLPAYLRRGVVVEGRRAQADYVVYENVDWPTAQAVAARLGQDLQDDY